MYNIFSLIYLFSIIVISYYFYNFFNLNILNIIKFFIFIFFISSLTNLFEFKLDAPYFCGGIPDLFNLINFENEDISRSHMVRLSFQEYIFKENSHLGMIAPGIIAFIIYYFSHNKLSIINSTLFFIFFLVCFLKSSTTLLLGTAISLIILVFFNFKTLNKKTIVFYSVITLSFLIVLIFNKECNSRFVPFFENSIGLDASTKEIVDSNTTKNEFTKKLAKVLDTSGNLSSAAYYRSIDILKGAFIEKPFGWGFNRYEDAFNHVNKIEPPTHDTLFDYNKKDGTNNFVKIFVEFGLFGICFYIFIFIFLFNKKIPIELKLFYIPIILTQSIRGAGYFNGGFILIAFLMLFTYISVNKKLK